MAKKHRRKGTRELSRVAGGRLIQRLLLSEGPIKFRLARRILEDLLGQCFHEIELGEWWMDGARGKGGIARLSSVAPFLRRAGFYLSEAAQLCTDVTAMERAVEMRRPNGKMTLRTARQIVEWHDGPAVRRQKAAPVLTLVPLGPGGAA